MKKAIIIGASSGIGKALAEHMASRGIELGLTSRRIDLLKEIQTQLPVSAIIKQMDITKTAEAMGLLQQLLEEMGDVDLVIVNAGVGWVNHPLEWEKEKSTIDTNVRGFTAIVNIAYKYFEKKGRGQLVSISSVAGQRGSRHAPAYNASKAYITNYMDGLRNKAIHDHLKIYITDIIPGFVDTKMAQGDHVFWSVPTAKAARQIFSAIRRRKKKAYISRRWRFPAFLFRHIPDIIYNRA